MRTIDLTRDEAMPLRKELISILNNYGIYDSYSQNLIIKEAIMNFIIEDMPKSTRDEKIQKFFQNIKRALMIEIAKYKSDTEKNNDQSIKEKIYQQINSAKDNLIFDNPENKDILTDYGRGLVDIDSPKKEEHGYENQDNNKGPKR